MITLFLLLSAVIPDVAGGELFLAGDQAERDKQHERAAGIFLQCAEQSEALRPYAWSRAARSHHAAGNVDAAETLFHRTLKEYPDGPWVRLTFMRLGDLYYKQGSVLKARECYNSVLKDLDPVPWFLENLAWNNADYALKLPGYENEGFAYFQRVAEKTIYLKPRRDAAQRLLTSPDTRDRLQGVTGYARSANLKETREAMSREMITLHSEEGVELPLASLDIAMAGAQADVAGTQQRLGALINANKENPWVRVWLMLAAREQVAGKRFTAAEMLARLLSEHFPDGRDAGDVWWYLSERCEAAEDKASALRAYRQLADRHPGHVRAPRALYNLATYARESGKVNDAFALYDELGKVFPQGRFTAEGYYRAAQMAEARKDKDRQEQYLSRAAGVGFGHFYAHRALHRSRQMLAVRPADARSLRVSSSDDFIQPMPPALAKLEPHHFLITNTVGYERINFFGIHGLEEGEWEALYCILTAPESLQKHLFPAIADAGFMHTLHQYVFDRNWGMEDGKPTAARLRVEYPLAYWSKTTAVSKELGIDPYLVLAIARQESTFRAGIVSSAGATGVLQLMPGTAQWLAKVDDRIAPEQVQHLKSPYNSIRLGAVYLQRMLSRSQENKVFALASYNAGPGNCDKWRARFPNHTLEEFVEAIPFAETNDYVKKVLANYAAYHSIYPPPDSIE